MTERAALYLRVSTQRRAERQLSIPDQRIQCTPHRAGQGWPVVEEYVEAGASGTDDRRPAFQKMMEDAAAMPRPFEIIVVHSYSGGAELPGRITRNGRAAAWSSTCQRRASSSTPTASCGRDWFLT